MQINNLKINKKKIGSIIFAFSLLFNKGYSEIKSFNNTATLKNGKEVFVYYKTDDFTLIEINGLLSFISNSLVNYDYLDTNNDYSEVNTFMKVNESCFIYNHPCFNNDYIIDTINKDIEVQVFAKNSNGWYVIYTNNKIGFINEMYLNDIKSQVRMAKIIGNNVNIRSGAGTSTNIIGFSDTTDYFKIIGDLNDWYKIDYLGKVGYVSKKYASEKMIDEENINYKSIVYLTNDSLFYKNLNGEVYTYLPKYQNAFVISEDKNFYKVMVDGIIGYINKNDTKELSNTCIIIDLPRQILRVYKNTKEIRRFHIITGREELQTTIGCFKIGHHINGYQLTPENYVNYWIQYNGNEGIHDALWQDEKYFYENAKIAYNNFANGKNILFPKKHGSHGCSNMMLNDAKEVYDLVKISDNVLVIGSNNLINFRQMSKDLIKIKKLV